MKKILLIVIIFAAYTGTFGLILTGCTNESSFDAHTCERPKELSPEMCGGTPIAWDCDWQMAYNEGKVIINRDSTGCITSIVKVNGEDSGHDQITIDVEGSK